MEPIHRDRSAPQNETTRRAAGALESAVMAVLWEAGTPLTAAEVRERLDMRFHTGPDGLAISTILTILGRLREKNVLSRERRGRAFRYEPLADEAGLAARRLTALLDAVADRGAVLSRFVEDLPDHDEQLLRDLLDLRTPTSSPDLG
ncbi:BlaI/MecI/CopY family transcriptional regulator [Actinospica robiniae]|uniref:BlaI/MecI/CopY family transcriptional regulator n=1 Tax=Actinospica robiniae TaxID=304901 RepID=UPI000686908F|nr:BlaI/MecI/CopY family transcriptional regulator [Actinospica robiniae]